MLCQACLTSYGDAPASLEGAPRTPSRMRSLGPCCSRGPGTYRLVTGPASGQNQPRLKPLMKATPLPQPRMSRYVSGSRPETGSAELLTFRTPLCAAGDWQKAPCSSGCSVLLRQDRARTGAIDTSLQARTCKRRAEALICASRPAQTPWAAAARYPGATARLASQSAAALHKTNVRSAAPARFSSRHWHDQPGWLTKPAYLTAAPGV